MNKIFVYPGDLDEVLKRNRSPGTQFILGSGIHTTRGAFFYDEFDVCMIPPGCELIGEGSARTKILLKNPDTTSGVKQTPYIEVLTGGARTVGVSGGIRVEGLTIDCDCSILPQYPRVGLHLWSSNCIVKDVVVRDIWGDRSREYPNEGFGILTGQSFHSDADGGHLIEDCKVFVLKDSYCCAAYIGGNIRPGIPMLMSEMNRVSVVSPGGSHAGFGINDRTVLRDCHCYGFDRAVFCDTGSGETVRVINMEAFGCSWALDLRANEAPQKREDIHFYGCFFNFHDDSKKDAQAVLLSDDGKSGAFMGNISFRDCRFSAKTSKASMGRFRGDNVSPVVFDGCTWIGSWTSPIRQDKEGNTIHD